MISGIKKLFIYRDNALYTLLSIGLIVAAFIVVYKADSETNIERAINASASTATAIAIIYAALSYRKDKTSAILEFYAQGDSKELIDARTEVYEWYHIRSFVGNHDDVPLSIMEYNKLEKSLKDSIVCVCNYYESWGVLLEKKYLPFNIFDSAVGVTLCRCFEVLKPYIEMRQLKNEYYAKHFVDLNLKIRKVYKLKPDMTWLKNPEESLGA